MLEGCGGSVGRPRLLETPQPYFAGYPSKQTGFCNTSLGGGGGGQVLKPKYSTPLAWKTLSWP